MNVSSGRTSRAGSRRQPGASGWWGSPGGPSCWMKMTAPPVVALRGQPVQPADQPGRIVPRSAAPNEPCCMSMTISASVIGIASAFGRGPV